MGNHPDAECVEAGRALGHDLYRYRRPQDAQGWPGAVCEGFMQAHARRIGTEMPDRFVRKWLQLRLNALTRHRHVDSGVTPALLREIDVADCPVTRERLTHGELTASDWSVDRLNNDGAYAANNLAVMSTRANRAKGARSFEDVVALSRLAEPAEGLSPQEWLRLAGLMLGPCFAGAASRAPLLPLLAPVPKRSVQTAAQLIQHALSSQASRAADKNRLVKHWRAVCDEEGPCQRLCVLADVVHEGLKQVGHPGDVWLLPATMPALARWKASLSDRQWALAGRIAGTLVGARVVPSARLHSWRLPTAVV